jgi:hypothetical protein
MPPRCAPRRPLPCRQSSCRVLPPASWLAAVVLLAPEWSAVAVIATAALVWRRHHSEPR